MNISVAPPIPDRTFRSHAVKVEPVPNSSLKANVVVKAARGSGPTLPRRRMRPPAPREKTPKDREGGSSSDYSSSFLPSSARDSKLCRKIIFLDVDGVLHEAHFAPKAFRDDCMESLASLWSATHAEIILSSTWRFTPVGRQAVNGALKKWRVGAISGFIENSHTSRAASIKDWLSKNCKASDSVRWIALDDEDMRRDLGDHMVHTNGQAGLTKKDSQCGIAILNDEPFVWDSDNSDNSDCSDDGGSRQTSRSST
jgi:hypothetical protein